MGECTWVTSVCVYMSAYMYHCVYVCVGRAHMYSYEAWHKYGHLTIHVQLCWYIQFAVGTLERPSAHLVVRNRRHLRRSCASPCPPLPWVRLSISPASRVVRVDRAAPADQAWVCTVHHCCHRRHLLLPAGQVVRAIRHGHRCPDHLCRLSSRMDEWIDRLE